MNCFCTVELNMRLARLAAITTGIIKMASARMGLAKTMRSQKVHDLGKCPVVQAAGHILRPLQNPLFYCGRIISATPSSVLLIVYSSYTLSSSVLGSLEIMRPRYETGFCNGLFYTRASSIHPPLKIGNARTTFSYFSFNFLS